MPLQPDVFYEVPIPSEAIIIDEKAIVRWLGYEGDSADPYVMDTIREYIKRTHNLINPKGGILIKPVVSVSDGILSIANTQFNIGKIVSAQLKHAQYVALFVGTIGNLVEQFSNQLFNESEMLEGYMVNLIGSEAAEATAEYVHQIVMKQSAEDGLRVSNRFSPGYCNWDVGEQFRLFSQFPSSFNEVTLTDSALMNPVKSVSGIIGIGAKVKNIKYKCSFCTDAKCIYRNIRGN
jgi:hypothetical protein